MKDTLQFILSHMVEDTDSLTIDETDNEGKIILTIHAAEGDMGRIIGKHGRIIKAIRDVIKMMAIKQNKYVDVMIAE
jgi:uncharacterized protein